MADVKITSLTAISTNPVNPATFPIPMVDLLDTSMAASGTTKKVTVNQILGSGGVATLASATITGDLTVATNTLKTTSGNVGIGTSSPTNKLHVKSTGSTPALIETSGGGLTYLQFTSTSGSAYIGNNANALGFYTTGSADLRMSLAAAGDLSITSGNVVMSTSGKGIDFSATADGAGRTSELLADYEEGTWTATLNGTVADPTVPVTTTGRYTKIGRVVSISAFFSSVITTGASGRIQITGLPFTNNSSIVTVGTAAFNKMATFTGSPFSSLAASSTTIIMFSSNSAADYTAVLFNAGTTQDLWVSLSYTVA